MFESPGSPDSLEQDVPVIGSGAGNDVQGTRILKPTKGPPRFIVELLFSRPFDGESTSKTMHSAESSALSGALLFQLSHEESSCSSAAARTDMVLIVRYGRHASAAGRESQPASNDPRPKRCWRQDGRREQHNCCIPMATTEQDGIYAACKPGRGHLGAAGACIAFGHCRRAPDRRSLRKSRQRRDSRPPFQQRFRW